MPAISTIVTTVSSPGRIATVVIRRGPAGQPAGDATVNAAAIAAITHAATAKNPPVDADEIGGSDSAASWGWKKITWAVIKSTLKTYFDEIYSLTGHNHSGVYLPANDASVTNSRNAADVSTWAKATTKPSYTYTEVGADPAGAAADVTVASIGAATATQGGKADTSLQTTGGTMTGGITLSNTSGHIFPPSFSSNSEWAGDTVAGVAGETIAFGELLYLKGSDSRWWRADADAEATAGPVMLGLCVLGASAAGATKLLTRGTIRCDSYPSLTVGDPVWVSQTIGAIATAGPTGTNVIRRIVGYASTASKTIHVQPSTEWTKNLT